MPDARKQTGARNMSPGATGEKRSPQARQIWLKAEGRTRTAELRGESASRIEERVRGLMSMWQARREGCRGESRRS